MKIHSRKGGENERKGKAKIFQKEENFVLTPEPSIESQVKFTKLET